MVVRETVHDLYQPQFGPQLQKPEQSRLADDHFIPIDDGIHECANVVKLRDPATNHNSQVPLPY
jgi:hypothetical protein